MKKIKKLLGILFILPVLAATLLVAPTVYANVKCDACFYTNQIKSLEKEAKENPCETKACADKFLEILKGISAEIEGKTHCMKEKLNTEIGETAKDWVREDIKNCEEQYAQVYQLTIAPKTVIFSQQKLETDKIVSIAGQARFASAATFLGSVIDLLVKFVGIAAFALLVFAGFRLVVAAGNDNEVQKAKTMITYAVVGLVVSLLAYLIVAFVRGILYN